MNQRATTTRRQLCEPYHDALVVVLLLRVRRRLVRSVLAAVSLAGLHETAGESEMRLRSDNKTQAAALTHVVGRGGLVVHGPQTVADPRLRSLRHLRACDGGTASQR